MTKEYNPAQIFSCQNNLQIRCQKGCKEHLFSLKSSGNRRISGTSMEIQLCPYLDKTKSIAQNVWPEPNFDGRHYLPSFVIGIDKVPMLLSQSEYLESFSKRLEETLKGTTQILQPHPGLDKKKCGVCRCTFNDYLTHIRSIAHKRNIRRSPFQRDIEELAQSYLQISKAKENQNDSFYAKKLRSFKKSVKSLHSRSSLRVTESSWAEKNSEVKKHEQLKACGKKETEIDHQLDTMTLKKSEEKTNLNQQSLY